jgi:hypothetical protein
MVDLIPTPRSKHPFGQCFGCWEGCPGGSLPDYMPTIVKKIHDRFDR